ncbi:MAG: FAD-dependent monooxygenase [Ktedonobacteraceae bacterium]|nr:FAD-dependent monooxygenase [Ktedonobacteraceae bacterium]
MSNTHAKRSGYDETTPVLIAGGSLVGLSTSLFLSWYGIPCIVLEPHAGTSPHPRAFNFNMRTMEFFRTVGAEEAIRLAQSPALQNSGILKAESLVGKELGWVTQDTTGSNISPVHGSIIGQDMLEPVLRARAGQLGADIRFNTKLVSFEQDENGVSAVIRDRTARAQRTIRARYLIAADGHRSAIRERLGIKVEGPGTLGHQISILFSTNMQEALRSRNLAVCFINNAAARQGMCLVFARSGQGFALFAPYYPDKGEHENDFCGQHGISLVREAIGIADLPVEITSVRPWEVAAWVAEHFQQGNVFLVGNAAHVSPPAGAFGANAGIADAYNLAWKLAFTLRGEAGPELLATYSTERVPVDRLMVEQSCAMFTRLSPLAHGKSVVESVDYDAIAFGYRYNTPIASDHPQDDVCYEDPHHPQGYPGSHAPHVILEHDSKQLSTLDLFGRTFVLLTGCDGGVWQDAARCMEQALGLVVASYRIGSTGDFLDPTERFLTSYGVRPNGAVLIRPDGFIGWRAQDADQYPAQTLEKVLRLLLGRRSSPDR